MTEPNTEPIPDPEPQYWPLWVVLSGWAIGFEDWLKSLGGRWLRNSIRTFWALIALGGIILLIGPIINKPVTLQDISSAAKNVTNNWIAKDFSANYQMSKAEDGTLTAQVEERVTAVFPEGVSDQDVTRVLASQYQDHALDPGHFSATMDGQPIEIKQSQSPNFVTLSLGDGTTLRGSHQFVLRYTINHLAYPSTDARLEAPVDLLSWDVFGASWTQGVKGVAISFSLPEELNDRLVRAPIGGISYVILSDSTSLTAEPGSAPGEVTYGFTADQGLPPHSNAWFTMTFEPGTFEMPGFNLFYWVKVFGPAVPLAFLLLTMLFAFAARAVAWSDARGNPWYVSQSTPPPDITPAMAAQILESKGARELAVALKAAQGSSAERRALEPKLLAAARVAQRTGRIGDLPFALSSYVSAPERRAQVSKDLRRVPHGFVRDFFLWSPIALTLVQWGLVRQLSQQYTSSILWWPFTFVLVSTLLASIVVWIAYTQRPLTVKGALVKQHLLGVDAFAAQTQLLDRTTSNDPALPYAVLFGRPRLAGIRVQKLIETELSNRNASSGWLTSNFLTWARLSVRLLAILLVVGAITAVSVLPGYSPHFRAASYALGPQNSPDPWSQVKAFDASATLSRTSDGFARLEVVQELTVAFTNEKRRISQFGQQWPTRVDGQNLDVRVTAFTIDGNTVPYVTEPDGDTLLLRTKIVDALEGDHQVRVEYVVESAAVAAYAEGQLVDRVRWAALFDGWRSDMNWGAGPGLSALNITMTVDAELAEKSTLGGWMTLDTKTEDRAADWRETVIRFDDVEPTAGSVTHELTLTKNENGSWPFYRTLGDLGASLDFPAGTLQGTNVDAFTLKRVIDALPFWIGISLSAVAIVLGLAGAIAGIGRRFGVFQPGLFRDLVWWLLPAAAAASVIAMVWMTLGVAADDPIVMPLVLSSLAAVALAVAGMVLTRKQRATAVEM